MKPAAFGYHKGEYEKVKKNVIPVLIVIILIPTLPGTPARTHGQTASEKGLAIAQEADKRDEGFKDFTADAVMTLKNKHGEESIRTMRIKTLEVKGDGDKSLTIFDNPRDVKGTAFLNYSHKKGDDDQWLYLPALKRVKRISSRNKSGSFLGSEFSYEDISGQEVEKYTYKWLRDEAYQGRDCYVFERYPIDKKNSGYSRQVVWMDKKDYREWKIEFYDRKKSLLKILTVTEYNRYLEKYWRANEMNMVNLQNSKSTKLLWSNYQFGTGLKEKDFNLNSLKRAK